MKIISGNPTGFVILHAGKIVDQDFATEDEAWSWADMNIDDQVYDTPNWLADPIKYRIPSGTA